jgi:hypothetical protein
VSDRVAIEGPDVFVLDENWARDPENPVRRGALVMRVHDEAQCQSRGSPCVIHRPSNHSMRGFTLHWRPDRGIFERICPHGVGHVDPDQYGYWAERGGVREADAQMVHGCDGCCR